MKTGALRLHREIKQTSKTQLSKGFPYLRTEDFLESPPKEGECFEIMYNEKFLAHAYSGHSHKSDICIIEEPLTQIFFEKKLHQALENRKKAFVALPEAYRLIHSEADRIPGIHIEVFAVYAVITYFNHGIEHYQNELISALKIILPQLQGIYAKDRTPIPKKPETKLVYGKPAPENLIIYENGAKFIVKINSGLMTGLFLDQRANRAWLKTKSQGKSICNTFSYTASLSLASALGGAKETTSVDISKTYSMWAKENFTLNNIDLRENHIITNDTFDHFQFCRRKKITYDIIILDPPTFAKKKNGTFSVQKNYQELILQSIPLLNNKGMLICSTNYTQWFMQDFLDVIDRAFTSLKKPYKMIYKADADKDFPISPYYSESNHLKFVALQLN